MIKKRLKNIIGLSLISMITVFGVCACSNKTKDNKSSSRDFSPMLDTKKETTLEIAGYMGNFEALDQVINDFNKYYPNVTVTYEQNDSYGLVDYLKNNEYVDIFMTDDTNVRGKNEEDRYAYDYCLDLKKENIDMGAIDSKMIDAGTVDGKLVRIPLAKNMCGMVVNETLLKKEGLEVPKTYSEFLNVCEVLKKKGYTPIQSSKNHIGSDMTFPMSMNILGKDDALIEKADSGDGSVADDFRPMFEKLDGIIKKGYISQKVNDTYPDDNYDGSILSFFEGNVPFWICTTECFSGMKKRETKSEAFIKNSFDYKFVGVPLSDDGVYNYEEPWYGFSVNKNSDNKDYAVEFMRFLTTEKEINTMAQIKGMPSVALKSSDDRYKDAQNPKKSAGKYVYDGKVKADVNSAVADMANQYCNGKFKNVDEAVKALKERIKQIK